MEEELLWKRICERLKQEPERKKYNEDKKEWMQRTVQFYEEVRSRSSVRVASHLHRALCSRTLAFRRRAFGTTPSTITTTVSAAS